MAIRDRLIMLEIRPSEPIDDDALACSLGVGRTPVREALKRLEGDRLVVTFPRRGTFATGMDITDLAHISEIRVQLEPLAARRAAPPSGRTRPCGPSWVSSPPGSRTWTSPGSTAPS